MNVPLLDLSSSAVRPCCLFTSLKTFSASSCSARSREISLLQLPHRPTWVLKNCQSEKRPNNSENLIKSKNQFSESLGLFIRFDGPSGLRVASLPKLTLLFLRGIRLMGRWESGRGTSQPQTASSLITLSTSWLLNFSSKG